MDFKPIIKAWFEEPGTVDELQFTPHANKGWAAWNTYSPEEDVCVFAGWLVHMTQARTVLETGVGQGFMTRRLAERLPAGGRLVCFEADKNFRKELRDLDFFDGRRHILADTQSPTREDYQQADLIIFDSEFEFRFPEIQEWLRSGKRGSVIYVHDTGNGHAASSPHEKMGAFLKKHRIPGFTVRNPRGSFVGVKP